MCLTLPPGLFPGCGLAQVQGDVGVAAHLLYDWCSASGAHCQPLGRPTAPVEVRKEFNLKL